MSPASTWLLLYQKHDNKAALPVHWFNHGHYVTDLNYSCHSPCTSMYTGRPTRRWVVLVLYGFVYETIAMNTRCSFKFSLYTYRNTTPAFKQFLKVISSTYTLKYMYTTLQRTSRISVRLLSVLYVWPMQ